MFMGYGSKKILNIPCAPALLPTHQFHYRSLKTKQCVRETSNTLPPLQTHTKMHTCPHIDKTSTTVAPNVFAHGFRLTALPH